MTFALQDLPHSLAMMVITASMGKRNDSVDCLIKLSRIIDCNRIECKIATFDNINLFFIFLLLKFLYSEICEKFEELNGIPDLIYSARDYKRALYKTLQAFHCLFTVCVQVLM